MTESLDANTAGRSKASDDVEALRQQRIIDIQGEVLTRLLTARVKVTINGQSKSVGVLRVIVQQVISHIPRGDDRARARARKILMGYVSLVPKSQRAAVSVALNDSEYTAGIAAQLKGDGDAQGR